MAFNIAGSIPVGLCGLSNLSQAYFGSNANLGCFPSCLTSVPAYQVPNSYNYCPSDLERIMCGIISGMRVNSSNIQYSEWVCDSYGHLSGPTPCLAPWNMVNCQNGEITSLEVTSTLG